MYEDLPVFAFVVDEYLLGERIVLLPLVHAAIAAVDRQVDVLDRRDVDDVAAVLLLQHVAGMVGNIVETARSELAGAPNRIFRLFEQLGRVDEDIAPPFLDAEL